jgi:VWFA-related protein
MRGLCIIALAGLAFGQAPIQVTTRLVQVAVVVRDKHGAVADLTKNDFEIFDKGKPRTIASFAVARASDHIARTPLPPNTFSNRLDQQADAPVAATVLLFDSLNTPFGSQADARNQVLHLLKALDPASPIAIYALGNDLRILHDFTEDHARLEKALQRYQTGFSALLDASQSPAGGIARDIAPQDLATAFEAIQTYATDRRVAMTLSAMEAIANRMAGVSGRKNLIWISGAFPLSTAFDQKGLTGGGLTSSGYAGQIRQAAVAIDRANVAVYPVDARGLAASNQVPAASRTRSVIGKTGGLSSTDEISVQSGEIDTMIAMADWTGGRAFYNTNDIRAAVTRAMEDAEVTYTVGFYPEEKDLDGKYHELKVKVARKGTETRFRKGYFASPNTPAAAQTTTEVLRSALASPADSTGLGLIARLTPVPAPAGSYILDLTVDFHNLHLEARNDRWADDIHFSVIQQDAAGNVLSSLGNTVRMNVTDENRRLLMQNGFALKFGVTPVAGVSQIRIAVMDQLSGNVGSLRLVPPARP